MTAPARFKQSDVARAYKALSSAGMRVGSVEIDANGKIVFLSEAIAPTAEPNPWDRVLK